MPESNMPRFGLLRSGIALAFAASVVAASPQVEPGLRAIRAVDLRADVAFLTSAPLEGRLSLRRGDDAAIQFIAAEFAKAGLRPAAGDSFLQPVPLVEYRIDRVRSRMLVEAAGTKREFSFGGGGAADAAVRAPVVFAGYGITAPEFGYDDYATIDARGKAVLVFDHEPQETDPHSIFNGTGNTRYANTYVKVLIAQQHGALAVMVVPEPNRKHPTVAERMLKVPGSAERGRLLQPQALAEGDVHIPLLTVNDEAARAMLSATGRSPADLQAAIDATLRPASAALPGVTVDLRVVLAERRRGESANVVGVLEGSDRALRQESVVFSAHHDHDGEWGGHLHPGADDNASGTAGVLALARAFARNPQRPRRTLVFAIFTAEERGLLGAYHYAAHPLWPLAGTRAVINFDMIGRNEAPGPQTDGLMRIEGDTSNELNLIGTVNSPDYRAAVERANEEVGLRLSYKWDEDTVQNIFQRSDQFPFVLHDIPAVWWFTGFHPDYHQTTDTMEKINFKKLEKILRLAYRSGWAMADAAQPPRFLPNPRGGK
jgi:hypothetical protein